MLVQSGKITQSKLERALELKRKDNLLLGQALVELGFISENELSDALMSQGKLACIRPSHSIVDSEVARELDQKTARRLNAVPINRIAGISTVAMADPKDLGSVDAISHALHTRIFPVHASKDQIIECLDYVHLGVTNEDDGPKKVAAKPVSVATPASEAKPVSAVKPVRSAQPVKGREDEEARPLESGESVVNKARGLLKDACDAGASDIHLEPRQQSLAVRFRVDGMLHDRPCLGKEWSRPCIAWFKALAHLDPSESRLPQDGRALTTIDGKQVDLRIATTPCLEGEGAVIRLKSGERSLKTLDDLGLQERESGQLRRMIEGGDGLVLATGPNGSGRTTALYAMVHELNQPHRKIITLEDSVTCQMEGVTQIHVDETIGLTFETGLRSIMLQDPDLVLVGEIGDAETVQASVETAMTGCLVLATLNTAGTVEAITRLENMGVESYQVADTLRGVLAQRPLRTICDKCRRPAVADPPLFQRLGVEPFETFEGGGCEQCRHTGYLGRAVIREILLMTPDLCRMVQHAADSAQIRAAAKEAGMVTLRESALRLAVGGFTTIHEVITATARG